MFLKVDFFFQKFVSVTISTKTSSSTSTNWNTWWRNSAVHRLIWHSRQWFARLTRIVTIASVIERLVDDSCLHSQVLQCQLFSLLCFRDVICIVCMRALSGRRDLCICCRLMGTIREHSTELRTKLNRDIVIESLFKSMSKTGKSEWLLIFSKFYCDHCVFLKFVRSTRERPMLLCWFYVHAADMLRMLRQLCWVHEWNPPQPGYCCVHVNYSMDIETGICTWRSMSFCLSYTNVNSLFNVLSCWLRNVT